MDLVELLNTRGIEYKKTNNPTEILVSCTSGEHTDKSPSLSYNLEKNIFHCWSCGFSGGINKFMKSIGVFIFVAILTFIIIVFFSKALNYPRYIIN